MTQVFPTYFKGGPISQRQDTLFSTWVGKTLINYSEGPIFRRIYDEDPDSPTFGQFIEEVLEKHQVTLVFDDGTQYAFESIDGLTKVAAKSTNPFNLIPSVIADVVPTYSVVASKQVAEYEFQFVSGNLNITFESEVGADTNGDTNCIVYAPGRGKMMLEDGTIVDA